MHATHRVFFVNPPNRSPRYRFAHQVMKDRSQSEEVVAAFDEYCRLEEELAGAVELFQEAGDDAEMREMARAETKAIEPAMDALEDQIKVLLLPKDPNDDRNCMLEIRAGTGGSEANIFAGETDAQTRDSRRGPCFHKTGHGRTGRAVPFLAPPMVVRNLANAVAAHRTHPTGDLLDVYRKFMSNEGWRVTTMDTSSGDDGGYKNVVVEVQGDSVYSKLKWEAGVHRVQRVPATETQGRVHTSTATVAIMVSGWTAARRGRVAGGDGPG